MFCEKTEGFIIPVFKAFFFIASAFTAYIQHRVLRIKLYNKTKSINTKKKNRAVQTENTFRRKATDPFLCTPNEQSEERKIFIPVPPHS